MIRSSTRLLPTFAAVWLGLGRVALADPVPAPTAPLERPAPVTIDLDTGARTVIVPSGCTSTSRPNGQVVVLCPFAPPEQLMVPAPAVRAPPRLVQLNRPGEKEWYGWQILIADGASVAAGIGVGLASNGDGHGLARGLGTTALGYALAAPIVHWANGQVGPGFGSMSLRVGAPLVMAAWGAIGGAVIGSSDNGAAVGAGLGAAMGVIGALVVDIGVLAYRPVDPKERERVSGAAKKPAIQWLPTANYDARRAATTVGVVGTF